MFEVRRSRGNFEHPTFLKKNGSCQDQTMLIGLTPARTDFFTGFMLKKNSKKLLHLFLNLVFLKKVFEVTLFYGTGIQYIPVGSVRGKKV